ncbi:WD40 repeat domain-containing protein [Labrenzia sp. DG1229]|uniref:WD40 repeat domain-containing protein n=1 Tax=Labrenzia sp. DG1229 TaxID=681847 RepID=UPI000AA23268|nr:WD40 repeat domain-containing protein [Labrenzia sp. DG1229]
MTVFCFRRIATGARSFSLFLSCLGLLSLALSATAAEFQTLKGHGGPVMDISVSPTNGIVATASFDNAVGVWSGRKPRWLDGHAAAVKVVRFVDEKHIVSAGDDNDLLLWSLDDGSRMRLEGHTAKVTGLAISPDGKTIASASWDSRIGLWPVEGGEPTFLTGHNAGVNKVAFSADGAWLYSASVDGSIKLWDVAKRSEVRVIERNGFGINVMVLGGGNSNETWVAYGSQDGVTRIVDIETGERLHDFTLERRPILAMALSSGRKPDGDW